MFQIFRAFAVAKRRPFSWFAATQSHNRKTHRSPQQSKPGAVE